MADFDTFSGNRGLRMEEPLIFEMDAPGRTGVDLPEPEGATSKLGGLDRDTVGLPGLSEPQVVRHYTRLSQKNYGIDSGFYPLGSCTMKHNPRLNEKLARLPGLGGVHPLQPVSSVQGALELIDACAHWLKTITGMPAIAMSPAAGAHGELCGMLAIKAAIERKRVNLEVSLNGAVNQLVNLLRGDLSFSHQREEIFEGPARWQIECLGETFRIERVSTL